MKSDSLQQVNFTPHLFYVVTIYNAKIKIAITLLILLTIALISHSPGFGQNSKITYDFDSLLKNNRNFEQIILPIADTMDIFNDNALLQLSLRMDFKQLIKQKYRDKYQAGELVMMLNDSVQVVRKIKVKPRGNMRKETCFIPPLKLNFPKKKVVLKQLRAFDKIKLVLDCKRNKSYEQYLIMEYYTYKMYEILTENSLRTRLLKVKYEDLSGRFKEYTGFAFIIENLDQLARRQECIKINIPHLKDQHCDQKYLALTYLFQYMIGNTDWSIAARHNMYIIKSNDPTILSPIAVPYDFDYAGLVNATYAVPDEQLGTKSVRERVYRGVCSTSDEVLQSAAARFEEKKKEIYQILQTDTWLTKSYKNTAILYLDEFFRIVENPRMFNKYILDACR